MDEYLAWKKKCAERTTEKVLKTIDSIMEDSNGHLDHDDLDRLKDCWKILHCIHDVK